MRNRTISNISGDQERKANEASVERFHATITALNPNQPREKAPEPSRLERTTRAVGHALRSGIRTTVTAIQAAKEAVEVTLAEGAAASREPLVEHVEFDSVIGEFVTPEQPQADSGQDAKIYYLPSYGSNKSA